MLQSTLVERTVVAPAADCGRMTGHSETTPVQKSSWGKRSAAECPLRCEFFELLTPERWRRKADREGAMRSRERPRLEGTQAEAHSLRSVQACATARKQPSNLSLRSSILIVTGALPPSSCCSRRTNGFHLQEATSRTKLVLLLGASR